MTRITCAEDCGNSPKKQQIRDLLIAMARAKSPEVLGELSDDVVLEMVGTRRIAGLEAARSHFRRREAAAELVIHNIVTHGPTGAANGELTLADGRRYAFSDFYRFSSSAKDARIRAITSYVIELARPGRKPQRRIS